MSLLKDYAKSNEYRREKVDAMKELEYLKFIERFQIYSNRESNDHLTKYLRSNLWKTMSTALLKYDIVLRKSNVKLIMCDSFIEGAFVPAKNQILLCSNIMMRERDFNNAIARQLIFMYDQSRGGGMHDLNKCKHLACTEVRAALFSDKCDMLQNTAT